MSNALYSKARIALLQAGINWASDDIKCALIDTTGSSGGTYTANIGTDQYLSVIPSDCIRSRVSLPNKAITSDGAADSDDLTFLSVAWYSGAAIDAVVIYKNVSGDDAASPLIAWIDTAVGLPIVPNGGDINIVFDSGINRIFRP